MEENNVPSSDEDWFNRIKKQQQQRGISNDLASVDSLRFYTASFTGSNPGSQAHCKLDTLQLLFTDKLVEDVVCEANSYAQDEMLSARVLEDLIWKRTGKMWLQQLRFLCHHYHSFKFQGRTHSAKTSSVFFSCMLLKHFKFLQT